MATLHSVKVSVASWSARPLTCKTKATTSAELAGVQTYGSDISASAIITSNVSPSLASKMMRPACFKGRGEAVIGAND